MYDCDDQELDTSLVNCGSFLPIGGGEYEFGLTLLPYNKAVT